MPHHLIDLVEPSASYSAGQFVRDAAQAIDDIEARGRVPLLVGGTMLYLRALIGGIATLPQASDADSRATSTPTPRRLGWPALHARLAEVDAAAAARIHPNDAQRIQRALEVHAACGRPISELQTATTLAAGPRDSSCAALVPHDRARLHAALAQRFESMMAAGLLDEVRRLYARGDLTDETSGDPRRRLSSTLVAPRGCISARNGGRTRRRRHASTRQETDDLAAFDAEHPCVRSL